MRDKETTKACRNVELMHHYLGSDIVPTALKKNKMGRENE